MLSFGKIWKIKDTGFKLEYSDSFILMLVLCKWVRLKDFRTRVRGQEKVSGIREWVQIFRIMMVLKILALGGFLFNWGVSTSLHVIKFYRNLSQTKVVLLPWNFLTLRNLASYDMSRTSKEIISLQKLYCFFKVFLLLRILLRTLDMIVLGTWEF